MGCDIEQVPGSSVWHTFDFTSSLLPGDAIVSATVDTVGVTAGTPQVVDGAKVSVEISGGVVGQPAQVTCWVTTAQGETLPWTICLTMVRKRGCC
jgi:hypothetical protein